VSEARRRRGLRWLGDPRVLLGIAITALALWYSFRDIALADLWQGISHANPWWLIALGAPCQLWSIYVRALRWRYLAGGVTPVTTGAAFRATAVGFMANNVFPLRMGELMRAWYLARETQASGAALIGTLIVERVLDVVFILALAVVLVGPAGARAAGIDPVAVLIPMLGLVLAILATVLLLRIAPERSLGLAHRLGSWLLPSRFRAGAQRLLEQLAAGLAGIQDWRALAWAFFHSAVLWWVVVVLSFWAALRSLGIDLGGFAAEWQAAGRVMVWVGLAVALPSAPGFLGPFHAACRLALVPLGVPKAQALALGTLAHAVFWLTLTGLGLVVLRRRGGVSRALETGIEAAPSSVPPDLA